MMSSPFDEGIPKCQMYWSSVDDIRKKKKEEKVEGDDDQHKR